MTHFEIRTRPRGMDMGSRLRSRGGAHALCARRCLLASVLTLAWVHCLHPAQAQAPDAGAADAGVADAAPEGGADASPSPSEAAPDAGTGPRAAGPDANEDDDRASEVPVAGAEAEASPALDGEAPADRESGPEDAALLADEDLFDLSEADGAGDDDTEPGAGGAPRQTGGERGEAAASAGERASGDAASGEDAQSDEALLEEDPDLYELRELVVAYTPEDVLRLGGAASLLDEDQLGTLEYDNPNSVLLQVPGVYVRMEDGFGLRPNSGLRGGNPERSKKVTLMEDGVLFGPAPYAAPAAYYFPLMGRMTGVEVFKGPSALLYGPQTIGGAINLRTRAIPDGPEGGADVAYGLYRARKIHFHWGTSNRHYGVLFEGLDVGSAGFKDIDGSNRTTGFSRSDFMLRSFAQTDPTARVFHRVELKLGFGRERSNETYLGLTDEDFHADPYRRYAASELDRMRWWRTQAQLRYRVDVGDAASLVTTLYRHDFDRSWFRLNRFEGGPVLRDILLSPTGRRQLFYDILRGAEDSGAPGESLLVVNNDRRFVSQGLQSVLRWEKEARGVGHHVEAGVRVHQDQVERDHVEEGFAMRGGRLVPDGEVRDPITDNFGFAFAFAAYAVYAIEVAGLRLTPGIRTEVVKTRLEDDLTAGPASDATRAVALPGIGAHYAVTEAFGVLAGVHRGYSPVAPGQPDNVDPELSLNYELGVRYSEPQEGRLLELVGFLNDYDNLTGQCSFATGCSPEMLDRQFNGGEVFVWGLEAAASWAFELGQGLSLPLRGSYTYTGSSFRTSFRSDDPTFGDVEEGDELPYVPEHQAQAQVGVEHARGGARVVATYVASMREEAGQGAPPPELETDDYVMLDIVGWVRPLPRLKTYVRAENVLNQQPIVSRRPFGARPLRPFSLQVGVEAAF